MPRWNNSECMATSKYSTTVVTDPERDAPAVTVAIFFVSRSTLDQSLIKKVKYELRSIGFSSLQYLRF